MGVQAWHNVFEVAESAQKQKGVPILSPLNRNGHPIS
jgi:hypothetical protein